MAEKDPDNSSKMTATEQFKAADQAIDEFEQAEIGPDEAANVEMGVINLKIQASRAIHETTAQDSDRGLPRVIYVGETPYDMWGIEDNRIKALGHMAIQPGKFFTHRELNQIMGVQLKSPAHKNLVARINTPGTAESAFRENLVIRGTSGKPTYSLVEVDDPPLAYDQSARDRLDVSARALLHARAVLSPETEAEALEMQGKAVDILQKAANIYRRLGLSATRGQVGVVLIDKQPYDLTGVFEPHIDLLWFMADRPWQTTPGPDLAKRLQSLNNLLKDIRNPKKTEHQLHPKLLRKGRRPLEYGFSGDGPPPDSFDAEWDYKPRPLPPENKTGRSALNRLPLVDVRLDQLPEIIAPDIYTSKNIAVINDREFNIQHVPSTQRPAVRVMAANPDRWFRDDEDALFGSGLRDQTRRAYASNLRQLVMRWRQDESRRNDTIERYIDFGQTNDGIRMMRIVANERAVGKSGFEAAGFGWMVEHLDLNNTKFQIGSIEIDISGLDPNERPIVQVLLSYPGYAISSAALQKMFIALGPSAQITAAQDFMRNIQHPDHVLYPLANLSVVGANWSRRIWLEHNDDAVTERFKTPAITSASFLNETIANHIKAESVPDAASSPEENRADTTIFDINNYTPGTGKKNEVVFDLGNYAPGTGLNIFILGNYIADEGLYEGEIEFRDNISNASLDLILPRGMDTHRVRRVLSNLADSSKLNSPDILERFQAVNTYLTQSKHPNETPLTLFKRLSGRKAPAYLDIFGIEGFKHPDALCQYVEDINIFFPERGQSSLPAQSYCLKCTALDECTAYGLDTKQLVGVWGGLSGRQRRQLINAYQNRNDVKLVLDKLEDIRASTRKKIQAAEKQQITAKKKRSLST